MQTASLHHFLYRFSDYRDDAEVDAEFSAHCASRRVTIGHDSWLGHNSIIKPEVTVGDGAALPDFRALGTEAFLEKYA